MLGREVRPGSIIGVVMFLSITIGGGMTATTDRQVEPISTDGGPQKPTISPLDKVWHHLKRIIFSKNYESFNLLSLRFYMCTAGQRVPLTITGPGPSFNISLLFHFCFIIISTEKMMPYFFRR